MIYLFNSMRVVCKRTVRLKHKMMNMILLIQDFKKVIIFKIYTGLDGKIIKTE